MPTSKPESVPLGRAAAEVSDATREDVRLICTHRPPRPEPVVFRLVEKDLDHGVPPDFHGARLLPAVADALRSRPVSLLLAGPNGVGKTRQAWAMVRAARRSRCAALFSDGETMTHVWQHGQGWNLPLKRSAWAAEVLSRDTVLLISEVGDLRRHPFDFSWLDQSARFASWVVVDDVGASPPTPWVTDALYLLANERRSWKRPTVWTTHHPPERLRDVFGPAIASRLLGGMVLSLDGRDRRLDAR
jgi:DNA replication protein DnaC